MAFVTRRRAIKSPLSMTHVTFFLYVILIERLSGDSMVERRWTPGVVTILAVTAQPLKRHLSMAVATTLVLVKPPQRPARAPVVKGVGAWLIFRPMAALASAGHSGGQAHVTLVTPDARPMSLSELARLRLCSVAHVAARTAWLVMTLDTPEPKTVRMFTMPKDDLPAGEALESGPVELVIRFRNRRVHSPHQVIRCHGHHRGAAARTTRLRHMTGIAVSLVDPLAMTVQTLLVVRASQSRLIDIGFVR
jgi:hypothetical protein